MCIYVGDRLQNCLEELLAAERYSVTPLPTEKIQRVAAQWPPLEPRAPHPLGLPLSPLRGFLLLALSQSVHLPSPFLTCLYSPTHEVCVCAMACFCTGAVVNCT